MVTQVDEATEALERLRSELDERSEATGIIELDPSDPDNPSIEPLDEVAGAAVLALSDVFEVVKGLAEEGALELPTEPLPLADAALVTILANAAVAQRAIHADAEWLAGIMERAK
jgi:hypothetical protein